MHVARLRAQQLGVTSHCAAPALNTAFRISQATSSTNPVLGRLAGIVDILPSRAILRTRAGSTRLGTARRPVSCSDPQRSSVAPTELPFAARAPEHLKSCIAQCQWTRRIDRRKGQNRAERLPLNLPLRPERRCTAGAVPQLCPDRADSMARPAISTCVSPIFSGRTRRRNSSNRRTVNAVSPCWPQQGLLNACPSADERRCDKAITKRVMTPWARE